MKGLRVPGGGKPGQLVADVGPVPAWGWVGGSWASGMASL